MLIQGVFVAVFALNLWLLWLLGKLIWYRIFGNFLLACLPLLTVFFDQPRFELDFFWWRIAGIFAILAGTCLLAWVKFSPRKQINSGPYLYVRHPAYLGLIFIFVGWWWAWAAVYSFYFGMFILVLVWIQGYLEEKLILEKQFGEEYSEYRRQTGMFWIK